MTTSYFYGLNDAMLILGRSYAWQVQAINLSGRDLFKNQGKSEVRWFKYGNECLPITNLGAEAEIKAGLKGSIEIERKQQIETNDISYSGSNVTGGGFVSPSAKASVVGIEGKIEMEAGLRFEYPYKSNVSSVGFIFYTTDIRGVLEIPEEASSLITEAYSYEFFKLNTKAEYLVYELKLNDLNE